MINVVGLGYIGLPTALMMASHGVEVVGTNHSQGKVDMLKAGKTTFKEEGLDELFQAALDGGIKFTTEYQVADVYIVSVQTPYDKFTEKVEMKYVTAAIGDVLKVAPKGAIIVVESTVVSPASSQKHKKFNVQRPFRGIISAWKIKEFNEKPCTCRRPENVQTAYWTGFDAGITRNVWLIAS